jgi:hypothetical protein
MTDADTAFYKVINLTEPHQLLIDNILKTNALYTESKLMFTDSSKQTTDIVFSTEAKQNIPLQFVFTDHIRKSYSVEHHWHEKIIYISNEFLGPR